MTMRIVAILAEAMTARACLEGARAAALVEADAQIEALHVKVDPDKLVEAPEEIALQRLREQNEGTAEDRAIAVRAVFDRWLSEQTEADRARVQWREEIGAETDKVLQEAKTATLLVLARPHDLDAHDAMHAILFSTTRPLLIPPDWSASKGAGLDGHIIVAWKPTTQARQAVESAGPWLQRAAKVTILLIDERSTPDGLAEIHGTMKQLGVLAKDVVIRPDASDPAVQILKVAREVGADALVMGAYRHSNIVEWALGGTTRSILAKADIPLFLAH